MSNRKYLDFKKMCYNYPRTLLFTSSLYTPYMFFSKRSYRHDNTGKNLISVTQGHTKKTTTKKPLTEPLNYCRSPLPFRRKSMGNGICIFRRSGVPSPSDSGYPVCATSKLYTDLTFFFSTIVQFILYFDPLRSATIFWEIRKKWLV